MIPKNGVGLLIQTGVEPEREDGTGIPVSVGVPVVVPDGELEVWIRSIGSQSTLIHAWEAI